MKGCRPNTALRAALNHGQRATRVTSPFCRVVVCRYAVVAELRATVSDNPEKRRNFLRWHDGEPPESGPVPREFPLFTG